MSIFKQEFPYADEDTSYHNLTETPALDENDVPILGLVYGLAGQGCIGKAGYIEGYVSAKAGLQNKYKLPYGQRWKDAYKAGYLAGFEHGKEGLRPATILAETGPKKIGNNTIGVKDEPKLWEAK